MSRCKRVWRIATFHQALFYMQYHCHLDHALLQGHIIVPSNRAQPNFTYCLICSSNEYCHLYPGYIFFTPVIYKLPMWCTFCLSLWVVSICQVFPTFLHKCRSLEVPAMLPCSLMIFWLLDNKSPIKGPIKVKKTFTPEQVIMGKNCTFQLCVAQLFGWCSSQSWHLPQTTSSVISSHSPSSYLIHNVEQSISAQEAVETQPLSINL